jgi:hypothetical protein
MYVYTCKLRNQANNFLSVFLKCSTHLGLFNLSLEQERAVLEIFNCYKLYVAKQTHMTEIYNYIFYKFVCRIRAIK